MKPDNAIYSSKQKIDRHLLVTRNNPAHEAPDPRTPFTVGNGEFSFTADITGLQTFPEAHEYFPLCTMSQWGWHSFPVDLEYSKLRLKRYDTYGRPVGYASEEKGQEQLYKNLRENPHRLNLGAIGLNLIKDGEMAALEDLESTRQKLDMWSGLLQSQFNVFGEAVCVETCADPDLDAVSASVVSKLAATGNLEVRISFPYGSQGKSASNWDKEDAHQSEIVFSTGNRALIKRTLDKDSYFTDIIFKQGTELKQTGRHQFILSSCSGSAEISFTCRFSKDMPETEPYDFIDTKQRAAHHWKEYWSTGGAIQLANSSDSRAAELERRIVISQYLTAIQCSGTLPPAETGLACNSWYGKFHLEMHYWHAAHFTLWGRAGLLERSLKWYLDTLPAAKEAAARQGYRGARWTKMSDPNASNAPSPIGVFLVWQQPHPVMLAELCYRAHPDMDTLKKYRELVVESAEFMVSYAHYDAGRDRYVLGPPLIPAQEVHAPETCMNPAFELEYFRWGLKTANEWLARLGEARNSQFSEVEHKLSKLPVRDGVYLSQENCPETFTEAQFCQDHPSMLAVFGVLPGISADRNTVEKTLKKVLESWNFDSMWGWDFPMISMCCAKLGLTDLAVGMLLYEHPKNMHTVSGHNPQADREDLPLYLPGNGGLLLAAAMMAAGWDGDGGKPAPGFPDDGSWKVETEGLMKYI